MGYLSARRGVASWNPHTNPSCDITILTLTIQFRYEFHAATPQNLSTSFFQCWNNSKGWDIKNVRHPCSHSPSFSSLTIEFYGFLGSVWSIALAKMMLFIEKIMPSRQVGPDELKPSTALSFTRRIFPAVPRLFVAPPSFGHCHL